MSDFNLRDALLAAVSKALVPEDKISLKLAFDNIRNYAICAALFAASKWLGEQVKWSVWLHGATYAITILALGFLLLNALQSFVIGARFFDQLETFLAVVREEKGEKLARALYRISSVFATLMGFAFSLCVLLLVAWAVASTFSSNGKIM